MMELSSIKFQAFHVLYHLIYNLISNQEKGKETRNYLWSKVTWIQSILITQNMSLLACV